MSNNTILFALYRSGMAVYLPLCDLFVTRDRDQHKCFAELAQYADVGTEVSYFDEFAADL